jgi:polyketide synthase PksM
MVSKTCTLTITKDHPIVGGHTVHGQALLPGLAYIDLLYQLFPGITGLDLEKHCLKRLSISNPLIVRADRPVRLKITFDQAAEGWAVRVAGTETDSQGNPSDEKPYITAEVHEATVTPQARIDVAAIKQKAVRRLDLETLYAGARRRGLVHQGMIKAQGMVYRTDSGCLIEVGVDEAYHEAARGFVFHPALIDGAAMATEILTDGGDGAAQEDLYLPLYYESFYCAEPLQRHCFVMVDKASLRIVNEIRSLDLVFFNDRGEQIGQLTGITGKKVRFREQINPDLQPAAAELSHRAPAASGSSPADGGAEKSVISSDIEKRLLRIFAGHLGRAATELDWDRGFFEMGLVSSQLLALVRDLESAFQFALNPTLLFEYNNLGELAKYLAEQGIGPERFADREIAVEAPAPSTPMPPEALPLSADTYPFYESEAFLQDHLVYRQPALMGVTHPCLVIESQVKHNPGAYPLELSNIQFIGGPVTLKKGETVHIGIHWEEEGDRTSFATFYHLGDPGQTKPCCQGQCTQSLSGAPEPIDLAALIRRAQPVAPDTVAQWYRLIKDFTIGSLLQTIESAYVADKSTLIGKVRIAKGVKKGDIADFVFDPLLLNSCYLINLLDEGQKSGRIFIPLLIERLTVYRPMTETAYIVKTVRCQKPGYIAFDAAVLTETGEMIAAIGNASIKEVPDPALLRNSSFILPGPASNDDEVPEASEPDIAIVGLAGRYPQSYTVGEFRENLYNGKDCITEIPKDRWDWQEYYSDDRMQPGSIYSKWGGFIDDVDRFDPLFFNISPHEAELMNPEERLFLEHCWMALEDAGYTREKLQKATGSAVGVYVGVMNQEYPLFAAESSARGRRFGLGGGMASVANRISYFCDFHGPSMAVDTMCSGSLTAIYLACQALKAQRIHAALAGGVNLSIHPNKYLLLSQGQFISSKGHCESFGEGGDGYIPGEGVGVLFLKRLSDARRDRDHIYGVIKGAAINHGGKTGGYTVPSPKSQSMVIERALQAAGFDPESLSYIEAHGTGTRLGDPVEIAGLTKVFGNDSARKQYCRIGSVKSNIGHCESAAGVAGVIKVLLQMQTGKLFPSLHSQTLNRNIDFAATPFIVNQELQEWRRPVIDGRAQPLRAGVSSFGASGSNAHIVIEEYMEAEPERPPVASADPVIIVLSARNKERLVEQARQLAAALDAARFGDQDLPDMAYTLQEGREAMEERLALIVRSIPELKEKLESFSAGRDRIEDCYQGQVQRDQEAMALFATDEELRETVAKWIRRRKFGKLLSLWVRGLAFDWNQLYGGRLPRRISLPTYPFAKERFWITDNLKTSGISTPSAPSILHPLVHVNTSTLFEQRFSSTFTGREFFLADHGVKGQRVLPGVAYLEMARAAVATALEAGEAEPDGIRLKNVVWASPVRVGAKPARIQIRLSPEAGGEVAFEVYSVPELPGAEPVVHCQGRAVPGPAGEAPCRDLAAFKAQCTQNSLDSVTCYQIFETMGLDYGPAHRGVKKIFTGPGLVLAELALADGAASSLDEYVLHPGLMDACLQAAIGLLIGRDDGRPTRPLLPFALDELEIFDACQAGMWAFIRYDQGRAEDEKAAKVDMDLCDSQGRVCVRMKGLSSRELEGEVGAAGEPPATGMLLLDPGWNEQEADSDSMTPDYAGYLAVLCEPGPVLPQDWEARPAGTDFMILEPESGDIVHRFRNYAVRVFEALQNILKTKPAGDVLVQVVVRNQAEQQLFTGLGGLLKTAQIENPKLKGQLIEVEAAESWEGIVAKLIENRSRPLDRQIRYQAGKRWVACWNEIEAAPERPALPWKEGGVYLITGGAGGLGRLFAREIAGHVQNATLVLTGRSLPGQARRELWAELTDRGIRVEYRQADVTQKEAVFKLIQSVRDECGGIDGIIHSAGVIRDNFILNKNSVEFLEVLAPKVDGLVYLDQASRDLPLDFFVCFSSGSGAVGNAGQADYAAANAFMDAYARYRGSLVLAQQRHGRTLSINWPLWREGGMGLDEATVRLIREKTGMVPLQTANGIQAFYQSLASGKEQVLVIEGELSQVYAGLLGRPDPLKATHSPVNGGVHSEAAAIRSEPLWEKAVLYFKQLLSSVIKLPVRRIEADTPMERYGIDSVMVMRLTNQLEKAFGSLSKTLFYEYPNLKELTGYFLENYREPLLELLRGEDQAAITAAEPEKAVARPGGRFRFAASIPQAEKDRPANMAIIGVSGRYPMADDLEEFWENLKAGRDCITEIPPERWDWQRFYHPDKDREGTSYSKWGGFIRDVDKFDPIIFTISPREAKLMDPQERLFLETVWHTLEDAGYCKTSLAGTKAGVFVGVMYGQYQMVETDETLGKKLVPASSHATIANRVSYYFDFTGPSVALDTMCSSSLTAIHLACQSIRAGECEWAVAGGVNLTLHPHKYLLLSQGKFVSSDGRCRSFGEGGDGYVPGEGVGAVLIKPLDQAVRDGDHIYAVIKGSAVNHGGKTNGYSVPNPNAQAEVIAAALKRAHLNPLNISYIEAHGTGTSLGDPIEISGLTKAFAEYNPARQACSIGSLKSNIGHLESAAGIAGLTKILLQMKHRQLAPSLHSEALNPNIDFGDSPFYVQQRLEDWQPKTVSEDGAEKQCPRLAALSSFGAGGANAHIILEEWREREAQRRPETREPHIIVLSAKNRERLNEYCDKLAAFCEKEVARGTAISLADMAYTLQVGREPLEERLAVIAADQPELLKKLKLLREGDGVPEAVFQGNSRAEREQTEWFDNEAETARIVELWLQNGRLPKIAELWVNGGKVNWAALYQNRRPQPRRVSLPLYPFARNRYWVSRLFYQPKSGGAGPALHPLLDGVNPELSWAERGVVFQKQLSKRDRIMQDHRVAGEPIFPGVGYLEMIYAALSRTHPSSAARLAKVVWLRPFIPGSDSQAARITIREEQGVLRYAIQSGDLGHPVTHSQGEIYLTPCVAQSSPQYLPIAQIGERCGIPLDSAAFYKPFEEAGIAYGAYFKGVNRVWSGRDEALGYISLPQEFKSELKQYTLHPTLLDGALQVIAAAGYGDNSKRKEILLPFAVAEVERFNPLKENGYAYVKAQGNNRFDVTVTDELGLVCVKLQGVELRKLTDSVSDLFYLPVWKPAPIAGKDAGESLGGKTVLIVYARPGEALGRALAEAHGRDKVIALCPGAENRAQSGDAREISPDSAAFDDCLGGLERIDIIYFLGGVRTEAIDPSHPEALEEAEQLGVISLFRLVKSMIRLGFWGKRLTLKVVTNNVIAVTPGATIKPYAAGLHGFTGSLAKENPAWGVSCVDIGLEATDCNGPAPDLSRWVQAVMAEPAAPNGEVAAWRDGIRYLRSIRPLKLSGATPNPFKHQGVYLIIGGAGGIGGELSKHLAQTVRAKLIIVGRSGPDEAINRKLAVIESLGGEVLYIQADVASPDSMKSAVAAAKSRFGRIDGVIHSALVLKDKTLQTMDEASLRAVLDPKVKGSVALYNALSGEKLDFMIFFSSAQSFGANSGQSNYAAACTFKDAFAQYLGGVAAYPVKIINWGYWGDVGVVAGAEYQKRMAAQGIYSIEPAQGMETVRRVLGNPLQQVIALKANEAALESIGIDPGNGIELLPGQTPSLLPKALDCGAAPQMDADGLNRFKESFAELSKLGGKLVLRAFNELGVFHHGNERHPKEALQMRTGVIPRYTKLFDALLNVLAAAEWIHRSGDQIVTAAQVEDPEFRAAMTRLEDEPAQLTARHPEVAEHVRLMTACLKRYPEILRGAVPATDIIFPNSSMELVDRIYQGNTVADYYNRLVVWSLLQYLRERLNYLSGNEKLKILEVGAGTGGTSAAVLPAIGRYGRNLTYVYTDISLGFTQYGRKRYGAAHPFAEFKVLDIEADLERQGYRTGEFDVVIATNVLHATGNIQNTLANCKKLLKTHGWLLINEATAVHDFTTLTFGLLDGWWLFEDGAVRIEGSPLLSPPMWERVLRRNGFDRVVLLGEAQIGQNVIIAESNGMIELNFAPDTGRPVAAGPVDGGVKPASPAVKPDEGRLTGRITAAIVESLAEVLQVDREAFEPNLPFTDFGVDSVLAVEIVNRLNERLDINLRTTDIFNYSTVKTLTGYIREQPGLALETETAGIPPQPLGSVLDPGQPPETATCEPGDPEVAAGIVPEPTRVHNGPGVNQDIAIIGISGQFPGARDLDAFWDILANEKSAIEPVKRWDKPEQVRSAGQPYREEGNSYWLGHLENFDQFDPAFFNISPREAEMMDPQQRLFLMESWKALEDAGYSERDLNEKKCGVFAGCGPGDYAIALQENQAPPDAYSFMGNDESILAARISYFLNLKGPSLAINTACSSALVAVHLACDSLRNGSCQVAIAGGVTVLTTPRFHLLAGRSGMLSPDGRCKTFDDEADGFVPGEGVGVVVLKPFADALRDNDHVYAVIKGSGINQDGRTNGITAPSALSQKELETEVYDKYAIDPATITYIETHGTGTKLGDPIEIEALSGAFAKYTAKKQFCAVGSVKTNIGHTLTAAGIAGLLKIVLCLKHRQLVPSLNLTTVNRHIDFAAGPFYVSDRLREWPAGDGQPRRAALSSFGFSGTNAHFVVEEAGGVDRGDNDRSAGRPCYLFTLSAKSGPVLHAKLAQLAEWLAKEGGEHRLKDIAFTLNAGRSHFKVRAAIVAGSIEELAGALRELREGKSTADGMMNAPTDRPLKNNHSIDTAVSELIAALHHHHSKDESEYRDILRQLAAAYLGGNELDWSGFHHGENCRRIAMPTYPFATGRYWIPEPPDGVMAPSKANRVWLHPLIERNTSTLDEQRFTTGFSGNEFYLNDHVLGGAKVLPAAAFIELARAAGDLAAGDRVVAIRNLVWPAPFTIGAAPRELHIGLYPSAGGIDLEIYSTDNGSSQRQLHCRGQLVLAGENEAFPPRFMDVAALRARCSKLMNGSEFYELVKAGGLYFGPAFQVIAELWGNSDESLARIAGPEDSDGFLLHPALLDAALQTALAGFRTGKSLLVPFSIGAVNISKPLTGLSYVYATRVAAPGASSGNEAQFDILLLNQDGEVLAEIDRFGARPYWGGTEPAQPSDDGSATIYYRSCWENREKENRGAEVVPEYIMLLDSEATTRGLLQERLSAARGDGRVILVKPGADYLDAGNLVYEINPEEPSHYGRVLQSLQEQGIRPGGIIHLWSKERFRNAEESLDRQQSLGVYSLFHLARHLLEQRLSAGMTLLYVYPVAGATANPLYEAVGGFAQAARLENPGLICKTVGFPEGQLENGPELAQTLESLWDEWGGSSGSDVEVRYAGRQRTVKVYHEFVPTDSAGNPPKLKRGGVYLITGGLGALGYVFAEYLAREFKARLILTGRSRLTPEQEAKIERLESLGAKVLYFSSDISNYGAAARLVAAVKRGFTDLNGIIHCAGVIRDKYIINKNAREIGEVMAAKVNGTVWLDEATKDMPLDFFVMFSSLAAVLGNAGQSDYAYANSFMDCFARVREALRVQGARSGTAIAINWPFWKEGGMSIDGRAEMLLHRKLGLLPLSTAAGINIFAKLVTQPGGQVLVLAGDPDKLRRQMGQKPDVAAPKATEGVAPAPETPGNNLTPQIQRDLIALVAQVLKINAAEISVYEEMSEFGFDSISLTELSNRVNERFDTEVIPATFFEHSTLGSFSDYFWETYRDKLLRHYRSMQPEAADADQSGEGATRSEPSSAPVPKNPRFYGDIAKRPLREARRQNDEPVAIIGMHGVMPQSEDLNELWEHLEQGNDLITEIPADRWSWREIFGDPLTEAGKTNIKWGGFMKEVDKFDPLFFGISPKEAELIDPQQRIVMETVWKTIEDAGYKPSDLWGSRTGLFIGVSSSDYGDLLSRKSDIQAQTSTGMAHSMIVNRISYLLNLRGMSEPVDTACSSALVAIYRAVTEIQAGKCETAIAGGVNALLSPALYLAFSKAGMLSEDGRCKTFDKEANGYVRGEGCGAILLKPLSKARADGDHIYAVIKSCAVSHGGHANSLTAPNPNAQAEVLLEAWEKAGIDPDTLTYIEAHGTGTALGDPIEINGIKKAFQQLYEARGMVMPQRPYCGVGSIKTNIGHLEAASGIAGVLKVLLALKHGKIPASIHFKELNPYIKLEDSPLYIVNETRRWEHLSDRNHQKIPRRAGISSFGYGGVNAHIVVEEYAGDPPDPATGDNRGQVIALSAQTPERLRVYAGNLGEALKDKLKGEPATGTDYSLARVAYTLQVGREALEERLAFVAANLAETVEKLEGYYQTGEAAPGMYRGTAPIRKKADPMGNDSPESDETATYVRAGAWDALARTWTEGQPVNWKLLYHHQKVPGRVSLPTYPFVRKRFWIPEPAGIIEAASPAGLHPLIGENISTLKEEQFVTRMTGDEFYLTDHKIGASKLLPGAAYLEMARAAGQIALESPVRNIRNIVWTEPVAFADDGRAPGRNVYISLHPDGTGLGFAVTTVSQDGVRVIHSEGEIAVGSGEDRDEAPEYLDIEAIIGRCRESKDKSECYRWFDLAGLHYGPAFQLIDQLYYNRSESLSSIELSSGTDNGWDDYLLHPALVDAALQTVAGLVEPDHPEGPKPYLPFALGEIEIRGEMARRCYAYVTPEPKRNRTGSIRKFDIRIADRSGRVLVYMKDFSVRAAEGMNQVHNKIRELLKRVEDGQIDVMEANRLLEVMNR